MGNLCGTPQDVGGPRGTSSPAKSAEGPSKGAQATAASATSNGAAAAQQETAAAGGGGGRGRPTGAAGGSTGGSAPSASKDDPVHLALAAAKVELEANAAKRRRFEEHYSIGKLIGHGAFAKVSTCTNNETQAKLAVKTVQKNPEDPNKQRDGACAA